MNNPNSTNLSPCDCSTRKRQYNNKKQATKAILKLDVRMHKVMVPYECKECKYWHIGHEGRF